MLKKSEKEALGAMLESKGWSIFVREVRKVFNPESALRLLNTQMREAVSVEAFGSAATVVISANDTAERLVNLAYGLASDDEREGDGADVD